MHICEVRQGVCKEDVCPDPGWGSSGLNATRLGPNQLEVSPARSDYMLINAGAVAVLRSTSTEGSKAVAVLKAKLQCKTFYGRKVWITEQGTALLNPAPHQWAPCKCLPFEV